MFMTVTVSRLSDRMGHSNVAPALRMGRKVSSSATFSPHRFPPSSGRVLDGHPTKELCKRLRYVQHSERNACATFDFAFPQVRGLFGEFCS